VLCLDGFEAGFNRGFVCDVNGVCRMWGAQTGRACSDAGLIDVSESDGETIPRESGGHGGADPARGAGDEGYARAVPGFA
jgi:hypothetical protein